MISATHIHAMVIHFPVALILAGFLSELVSFFSKKEFFSKAAFYLLILGALGAVVAYISGNAAGSGIEEGPLKKPLELHEQAATITLWLAIITAFFRAGMLYFKESRKWARITGLVLFLALSGAVARTGYLGGQLVYSHGAGVQLALPDFGKTAGDE